MRPDSRLGRVAATVITLLLCVGFVAAAPLPASAAVVPGATISTTANPTQLAIGQSTQYTLTITLPAGAAYYDAAVIDTVSLGMTPVGGSTLTCVSAGASCTADLPGRSTGYALSPSGQKIGWYLGTIASSTAARVITVTFSVRLDDVARNAIAGNPTNAVYVGWNSAEGSRPATAAATFVNTGPISSLLVRVTEPLLSVASAISDPTPEPGVAFSYTTTVSNANAVYTSSAFATVVTASVPEGIIVDQASITGGGVLANRTITWTLPAAIPKNATVTFTWSARLGATGSLPEGALVTTSRIEHYQSLATGGRSYPASPVTAAAVATPDLPALTVVKSAASGTLAYTTDPFGWVVTVTNSGRSQATHVEIVDHLPANWSFVDGTAAVSVNGGQPTPSNPVISSDPTTNRQSARWVDVAILEPGQSLILSYEALPSLAALVNPGAGYSVSHDNTVRASAHDRTGAAGTATQPFAASAVATARIASADLSISFSIEGTPVAGTADASAWTIWVSNLGPDPAAGPITVTETPAPIAGMAITSASGDGWSCSTPSLLTSSYSCTRSDANEVLAVGATLPEITVAASIDADLALGTPIHTSVSASSRTWDPNPANNVAVGDATIITLADLAVDIQSVGTVSAGETANWTIDVSNVGPSVAAAPTVVDIELPAQLSAIAVQGAGWSCTIAAPIRCTSAADLTVTGAPRITVSGVIPPSSTGSVSASATVSAQTADPVSLNNSDSETTVVRVETTVLFDKRLNGTVLVPGTTAEYVFTVENGGFADATGVGFVDVLPGGLRFEGMTGGSAGWSCVEGATAPSTFSCSLAGSLDPGAASRQSVTVSVSVPSAATGVIVNTATASAANAPSVSSTDGSQLSEDVDLGVTKTHGSGAVYAGTTVRYVVTVHNYGPTDAPAGLVMTDTVPAGFTPVSASGLGWDCQAAVGQMFSCVSSTPLPSAASTEIVVLALVPADAGGASYASGALVVAPSNEPAPDPHPNFATDTVDVVAFAAVTILRSITGVTLTAGESIDYTINVDNAGPSTAEALVVAGSLPSGFSATGFTGAGWDCSIETLVCSRASLGIGVSTLVITVALSSDIPDGTVVANTAELTWTDSRPDRNSDVAIVAVTVRAAADLVLDMVAHDSSPLAGENIAFTATLRNNGPSDAVGPITITGTLPSGLRFVSTGAGWDCVPESPPSSAAQIIFCTAEGAAGVVAGGTAVAFTMVAASDPSIGPGAVVAAATAHSTTAELVPSDNTATATLVFDVAADLAFLSTRSPAARIGGATPVTVIVKNNGPSDAAAPTVEAVLGAGLLFENVSAASAAWSCVPATGGTLVSCEYATVLAANADSEPLVLNVAVDAAAYPAAYVSVIVSSSTTEVDIGDNSASIALQVDPLVQTSLVKTHRGEAVVGGSLEYVLSVANAGPTEDPGGFIVVDTLPAGLDFDGFDGAGVTCVESAGEVSCVFAGALAVGETRSVTLTTTVLASAAPAIVNTARLSSLFEQLSTDGLSASDIAAVTSRLPLSGGTLNLLIVLASLLMIAAGGVAQRVTTRRG